MRDQNYVSMKNIIQLLHDKPLPEQVQALLDTHALRSDLAPGSGVSVEYNSINNMRDHEIKQQGNGQQSRLEEAFQNFVDFASGSDAEVLEQAMMHMFEQWVLTDDFNTLDPDIKRNYVEEWVYLRNLVWELRKLKQ